MVGRAGFEPATIRFLRVSLVGWVIPTVGGRLQHLRQLGSASSVLTRKLCQAELPPGRICKMNRSNLCVSYKDGGKGTKRIIHFERGSLPFLQISIPIKSSRGTGCRIEKKSGNKICLILRVFHLSSWFFRRAST